MNKNETQAKAYGRWKRRLMLADLALTFFLLGLLLASGASRSYRSWILSRIQGWPWATAAYAGSFGVGMAILSFPLDWFRGFKLEHRFGLSTQGFPQWLWGHAKQLLIGGVLGLVLVEGLSALLRWTPGTWWAWAALLWLGGSLFLSRVFPTWLIPLFYRQIPLKDPALQTRLESLLSRCRTRVRGIFEINLSRTTRKANACLCGLGKTRRVLISDTLLETHPPEEVEVVLAHEVGHHRLHHMGILAAAGTGATLSICFFADRWIRASLVSLSLTGLEDLAALPLLGLFFLAADLLWMPWINGLSRILEAQADRYALESTRNPRAFVAAMRRLGERNLAEVSPPAWVERLFYDHPPISKRIAMAEQGR